jgi:hypothetical protein
VTDEDGSASADRCLQLPLVARGSSLMSLPRCRRTCLTRTSRCVTGVSQPAWLSQISVPGEVEHALDAGVKNPTRD